MDEVINNDSALKIMVSNENAVSKIFGTEYNSI